MSVKLFVSPGITMQEAKALVDNLAVQKVAPDQTSIGVEWKSFITSTHPGDTVIVWSLVTVGFGSLSDLLSTILIHDITIESITEPWFSAHSTVDAKEYQKLLSNIGYTIHTSKTRGGMHKASQKGKKPGRINGSKITQLSQKSIDTVEKVDDLVKMQKISIVKACIQVGIAPSSYYINRQKIYKRIQ